MIFGNRKYERQEPSRDAKCIYIFCEGKKRERQYFNYFKDIDSRIKVEVYHLHQHENNSPAGLFSIAQKSLVCSKENSNPKYEFSDCDEAWIVFDTDPDDSQSRTSQIANVRTDCSARSGWNVAQSNPCFEVWLYYHFFNEKPAFADDEKSKGWKAHLNKTVPGGFNCQKQPILLETAIANSKTTFFGDKSGPAVGSTEVYLLGESILPFVKEKLSRLLSANQK